MFVQTKTTCSPTVNWPKFEQKLTLIRCVWFGESYIFRPLKKMKRILKCDVRLSFASLLCHCMSEFAMNVMMLLLPLLVSRLRALSSCLVAWIQWNTRPNIHIHNHTRIRSHTHTHPDTYSYPVDLVFVELSIHHRKIYGLSWTEWNLERARKILMRNILNCCSNQQILLPLCFARALLSRPYGCASNISLRNAVLVMLLSRDTRSNILYQTSMFCPTLLAILYQTFFKAYVFFLVSLGSCCYCRSFFAQSFKLKLYV